jgi:hypothetical protein
VNIQVVFENKDWVQLHGPDQRDLTVVTDSETLKLGRMSPVSNGKVGTWDTKVEVLELNIPYATFKKIALSESVHIQVGRDVAELREKNRLALKDLNSRVLVPAATTSLSK